MAKYQVCYNGDYEDEIFDTEREAEEYASYLVSCAREGAEFMHMSKPGAYDEDDYDEDYEIIEIDEE